MPAAYDPSWNPRDWSPTAWGLISPWLLAAVVYVGSRVRRFLKRPSLSIERVYLQECSTLLHGQPGRPQVLGRLLVSNRARRDSAQGTHIVVVSHQLIDPPGEDPVEIRMALSWTHSDGTLATMHGGSPRFIDLVAADRGFLTAYLTTSPRSAGRPSGSSYRREE